MLSLVMTAGYRNKTLGNAKNQMADTDLENRAFLKEMGVGSELTAF